MTVNFQNIPTTVLPDDVILSKTETEELCTLESLRYNFGYAFGQLNEQTDLVTTTNVGIHYFCIDDSIGMSYAASNVNISLTIVNQIANRLKDGNKLMITKQVYVYLLFNPAVYKNKDSFTSILETAYPLFGENLLISLFRTLNYLPIDAFMVLLKKVDESDAKFLIEDYLEVAVARANEIKSWASENNPQLTELPLSWILKAYGFSI